jgi:hypothetical protein
MEIGDTLSRSSISRAPRVDVTSQEFSGALLMFFLQWPFVGVFGDTWTAWIAHFFFVMLVSPVLHGVLPLT